jgi:hypothetical protein
MICYLAKIIFVKIYTFIISVHISNMKTKLNSVTHNQFTHYYLIIQNGAKPTDTL